MEMKQEQSEHREIESETLAGYTQTFIAHFDHYPLQKSDGTYLAVREPLTLSIVEAHVLGTTTIGVYALDTQNQARWLCLDADDELEWHGLWRLAHHLARQELTSYLELSRRGGHLWLFFDPLPAQTIRRFGKWLLAEHDLETVELYPKQDQLHTGPGSLVRLPLGIHRKSNKRYSFVTFAGQPLAPTIREQVRVLANPEKVPHAYVHEVISSLPEPKQVSPTLHFTNRSRVVGETPSERIKNAISVYDFVSQYVDLERNGLGYCPFHDDHRMSFGVKQDNNFWHCFAGCGGGSVIDFWMKWRELHGQDASFTATITELAQMLL